MSHKHFLIKVAKQLIGTVRAPTELDKEDTENLDKPLAHKHTKTIFSGRQRACILCSKRNIQTRAGRSKETKD